MIEFPACQFWWLSQGLLRLEQELSESVDDAWAAEVYVHMEFAKNQCMAICLSDIAAIPLWSILSELEKYKLSAKYQIDVSTVKHNIAALRKNIELELNKHKFSYISEEKAKYFEQKQLFGQIVYEAFPGARFDIKEAGNCLAVDCGTAAVFHLMRTVEWGLRSLSRHLRVLRIPKSKKPGNSKYIPLAYAEWEKILDENQEAVEVKLKAMKRGSAKQKAQEFYYPLFQDLRGFRDAWRNHVMHTRAIYSPKDAEAIADHVKRFMSLLATRVSE